jgi:Fic family protein
MSVNFVLPVSQEILTEISRFDRFQGVWSAGQPIGAERLRRIEEATRIQSVAASCRLAGIRVTDAEVAGLLRGESVPTRDADEILGYARAWSADPSTGGGLVTGDRVCSLHALMLGREAGSSSSWREQSMHREAFDAEGHATGQIFATLPPRLVQAKTEELLTWLELELRTREQHPLLVIGTFELCLLSISPFEKANGRLARVLTGLLLRRTGYTTIAYSSLEARMEERREDYHAALSQSQTGLWTGSADLQPWLTFFLGALARLRERLETKIELERGVQDYPPLQQAILEAVREHGTVDASLLLQATGANRNTLKDNLRRLVQNGVIEKIGQRRGTRYRMSSGERASLAGSLAEH